MGGMRRSRRPRTTTEKVDQRISKLADRHCIAPTDDRQNILKRQNIRISQEITRRR